jgi:hypothetical protein
LIGVELEGFVLARRPTGPLRGVIEIRVGGLAAPSLGVGFEVDMVEKVIGEVSVVTLDVARVSEMQSGQTDSVGIETQVEGVRNACDKHREGGIEVIGKLKAG